MNSFKGFRTLVTNGVAAAVALAAAFGLVIPQDDSTAVVAGIFAVANIVLRIMTTTAVGKSE